MENKDPSVKCSLIFTPLFFLQNFLKDGPQPTHEGRIWNVSCNFKLWTFVLIMLKCGQL